MQYYNNLGQREMFVEDWRIYNEYQKKVDKIISKINDIKMIRNQINPNNQYQRYCIDNVLDKLNCLQNLVMTSTRNLQENQYSMIREPENNKKIISKNYYNTEFDKLKFYGTESEKIKMFVNDLIKFATNKILSAGFQKAKDLEKEPNVIGRYEFAQSKQQLRRKLFQIFKSNAKTLKNLNNEQKKNIVNLVSKELKKYYSEFVSGKVIEYDTVRDRLSTMQIKIEKTIENKPKKEIKISDDKHENSNFYKPEGDHLNLYDYKKNDVNLNYSVIKEEDEDLYGSINNSSIIKTVKEHKHDMAGRDYYIANYVNMLNAQGSNVYDNMIKEGKNKTSIINNTSGKAVGFIE